MQARVSRSAGYRLTHSGEAKSDVRTMVGCTPPTAKSPLPSRRAWHPQLASCGPPSTCAPTPRLASVPRRSQGEYDRVPTGPNARACSMPCSAEDWRGAYLAVTRGIAQSARCELPRVTRPAPHRAREWLLRGRRRVVRDRSAT
jgi:hypothetical protein